MRTLSRGAAILSLALLGLAGPAGAAPSPQSVAQATAQQGTLTGRVTDSRGNPVADATVTARGASGASARTGGDGRFSLALPPGVYTVVIVKGGFQSSETADLAIVAGTSTDSSITLGTAGLSSLQNIGRVSANRRNPLNTNVSAVASIGAAAIAAQEPPKLTDLVSELPGISLDRGNSTPNASFVVRGARIETRVEIDGHPVAQGQSGTYNLGYVAAAAFGSIEVTKGPGLFGPNAGESAYGTVNLRTPDFDTRRNFGDFTQGFDSNNGSYTKAYANANFLNGKLNLIAGKTVYGTRGVQYGTPGYRTPGVPVTGFAGSGGLVNFVNTLSSENLLNSELAKLRYNFSNTTSFSLEYLGLHGTQAPQGGSYNTYYGDVTVPQCAPSSAAKETSCGRYSLYNAPNAQYLIGTTIPSTAAWFANSEVHYNEPNFIGEFRTGRGNDTFLLRPYAATITRYIDGSGESLQVGNVSGLTGEAAWYLASGPGQCGPAFNAGNPTSGGLPSGYCFQGNGSGNGYTGGPYTNASNPCPTVNPAVAIPSNACYIAKTGVTTSGQTQYGRPFSQLEFDRLHGVTFEYTHPFGANQLDATYDYNSDDTLYYSGDTTLPPAGTATTLGNTSLSVPPTFIRRNSFSLVGLFNPSAKLQIGLGNYLTVWHADYQLENPAAIAAYTAAHCPATPNTCASGTPLALLKQSRSYNHYDPHLGITYRLDRNDVLRFSAGSAISTPYASQISGLTVLSNTITNNSYNVTVRNTALQPETTMAYDLGGDFRLRDGSVVSTDVYSNTTYGAFASNTIPYTGPNVGTPPGQPVFANTTVNAAQFRDYGVELAITKNPVVGFGYRANATLQRAFYTGLGRDVYPLNTGTQSNTSQLINGKQVDGTPTYVPFATGYGEISYASSPQSLVLLGMKFYGANNVTAGPGYTTFNAAVRFPLLRTLRAQISVDNLFDQRIGTLSPAYSNAGHAQITGGYNAAGQFFYGQRLQNLQSIAPQSFRFEIGVPVNH